MSGYRVMAGMGRLDRGSSDGPDSMGTASKVFDSTGTGDCLHQLKERIGVGMTLSISRTRNMNYAPEIGMREFAIGTPGMYDVEFTMDGIFAPSVCDSWLKYVFMQGSTDDPVEYEVSQSNKLVAYTDAAYTTKANTIDDNKMYYVQIGTSSNALKFGKKMLGKDINSYNKFVDKSTTNVVKLFGYTNLQGPKYFDIGYQKINAHASGVSQYDGKNEFGCLCGCIINSASITYDSGSDAAIRFSISGSALCDYTQVSTDSFDYSSILSALPTDVFVGGCMSVFKDGKYNAVAQTDSASVSISNNTSKLGNCNKLTYSSYAMAGLTYDVSTSTYSNDPEKYLKYLYGYDTLDVDKNYHVGRQAVPIGNMKIRTDDTSATKTDGNETMFMDINMNNVYVGDMNYNFSVDSPIMDEPSLRAQTLYMAVGYSETGISATDATESGGSSSSESGGSSDSGATGK